MSHALNVLVERQTTMSRTRRDVHARSSLSFVSKGITGRRRRHTAGDDGEHHGDGDQNQADRKEQRREDLLRHPPRVSEVIRANNLEYILHLLNGL